MVSQTSLKVSQDDPQSWLASPGRRLVCFLAALVVACGVACLYFYEVSQISTLRDETVHLQQRVTQLEHQNAAIMVDVAQFNAPAYIRTTALERGMAPLAQASYLVEPVAKAPAREQQASLKDGTWQAVLANLTERLLGSDRPRDVAQVGP